MESLFLLVPLSVALVLLTGWLFWRALEGGQFDDLDRPGYAVLDDDDAPPARRAPALDPRQKRPPATP